MTTSEAKPDAYGVWDTQEQRWWYRRNKRAWGSKTAAANAWNAQNVWTYPPLSAKRYSEQTRYVTKGLRFVPVD